jgi:hypothetical protein
MTRSGGSYGFRWVVKVVKVVSQWSPHFYSMVYFARARYFYPKP